MVNVDTSPIFTGELKRGKGRMVYPDLSSENKAEMLVLLSNTDEPLG